MTPYAHVGHRGAVGCPSRGVRDPLVVLAVPGHCQPGTVRRVSSRVTGAMVDRVPGSIDRGPVQRIRHVLLGVGLPDSDAGTVSLTGSAWSHTCLLCACD